MCRSAALALILVVLAPLTVSAQSDATHEVDPAVANYRLSMKKLWQVIDVQRGLHELMAKQPDVFDYTDQENEARRKAGKPRPTLKEQAAMIESRPPIRAVFVKAGTTPLDFLTATEAMASAMISTEILAGRMDSRAGPPPKTAAEKANVALLQKNQAEWKKIQEELSRLGDEAVNSAE